MRIYKDPMEMVREVERDLFEMGTRVHVPTMQDKQVADDPAYETTELQAYGYTITNYNEGQAMQMVNYMKGNERWLENESRERLEPTYRNPGNSWLLARNLWGPFVRDDQFAYTYNERFRDQLPVIVSELTKRPATRQAIITVYDKHQDLMNRGGRDRIPCSMHYQFFVRQDQLHLIYVMRSCDFLTHFAHDVYLALRLQWHVAKVTGHQMGRFTHFMGSLHAYQKDMEKRGIF